MRGRDKGHRRVPQSAGCRARERQKRWISSGDVLFWPNDPRVPDRHLQQGGQGQSLQG